jgi:hypothetical protein
MHSLSRILETKEARGESPLPLFLEKEKSYAGYKKE